MVAYARARVYQDEPRRELQRVFDSFFAEGGLQTMLDAGAGYELPIDVPRDVHLVGIDLSPDALAKNDNADEKIVGDIETYPLPARHFDAAVCWWVLEHVPRPGDAIANIAKSLRPGGIFVIGIPHLWSLKGLLTKFTPYRFHVWAARSLRGIPDAGMPGTGPYKTYLSLDLSPPRLRRIAAKEHLSVVYSRAYSNHPEEGLSKPLKWIWKGLGIATRALTLGAYNPLVNEYMVIFRRD
jgi:SAM-dependent methyltransferase